VLKHFRNPKNVGVLPKDSKKVGSGLVGAPACGDVMRLQIEVGNNNKITDVKFRTFGCPAAVAASSFASEHIKGKTLSEATEVKNTMIAKELCLPPVKFHCSMLAEDAIAAAVKDYEKKNPSK
ncbi:MAG: hypothetical protein MHPSP_003649, partial [Paramarteilia canceri]